MFFSLSLSILSTIFLKLQMWRAVVLLQLLLDAEVRGVTALLLTAVGGTGGETCVAATAHLLVAVVLACEGLWIVV